MSDSEEVVVKSVESQLVAASLGIIPNDREGAPSVIVKLFQKTSEYLTNHRNPVATELQYPVKKLKFQKSFLSWLFSLFNSQD
ncbi:MAG: hypothetical protein QNJ55_13585 [Xenococcus sp. MO_188.B8]|nr:hypothetical protein [Xenococcus sp. MO_188.B8]